MQNVDRSPESKVPAIGEVSFSQLILLTQDPLQPFLSFASSYRHMNRYFLIISNTEGPYSVAELYLS